MLVLSALQYRLDRRELLPYLPASMHRRKLAPLVAWTFAALGALVFLALLLTYGSMTPATS